MSEVIDLKGLPDPVAKAMAETIRNLKSGYLAESSTARERPRELTAAEADRALDELLDTLPPMPSLPDQALRRESIYAPDGGDH